MTEEAAPYASVVAYHDASVAEYELYCLGWMEGIYEMLGVLEAFVEGLDKQGLRASAELTRQLMSRVSAKTILSYQEQAQRRKSDRPDTQDLEG